MTASRIFDPPQARYRFQSTSNPASGAAKPGGRARPRGPRGLRSAQPRLQTSNVTHSFEASSESDQPARRPTNMVVSSQLVRRSEGRAPMLARPDTLATITESWLARLERALAVPGRARLKTLFHADSHWRDVLALTWQIKTVDGSDAILRELPTHAARARPTGFKLDPHRTAPRNVRRAGTDAIEAILSFETAQGRGSGVLRLSPDAEDGNAFRAWTLLTALDEIKGHEER